MVKTVIDIPDSSALQQMLTIGIGFPQVEMWVKLPPNFKGEKCPPELGDGRKIFDNQFYCKTVAGEDYAKPCRTDLTADGRPTGNHVSDLTKEEQDAWVNYFGSINFILNQDLPKEEVI